MLVFDIETEGLDASKHAVTIVCTENYFTGQKTAYEFARHPEQRLQLLQALIVAFDEATSLSAFNGVRFDIPFLQQAFGIDHGTVQAWICKTSDILEQCRLRTGETFKLDMICKLNGLVGKSADGLQAIAMAQEGRFDELRDYCADDVSLLCRLYAKRLVMNPRSKKEIDLQQYAHPLLYTEDLCEGTTEDARPRHLLPDLCN